MKVLMELEADEIKLIAESLTRTMHNTRGRELNTYATLTEKLHKAALSIRKEHYWRRY